MQQAKKIFTKMCINNWGGITHKIIEFNEYVNLFSGKSGSGKSTIMDAIQVILYGSFSPSFLNKAADDSKNRRSVLSYLRGEQKDGSVNRGNMDFYSHIILELEDTGTHISTCIGIAFEVGKYDNELKKYIYFSHSGKIDKNEYLNDNGIPYSNKEISNLITKRISSADNWGKGDVNRIYPSKEAYLNTVYDIIFGYIDGKRFVTMEKSAIALKMTNGTGQFIRDYMFPKSTENTIEKISEQLGAYREIKEKIDDLEKRIRLLKDVHNSNQELVLLSADIVKIEKILECIDIEDLKNKIQSGKDDYKYIISQINSINDQVQENIAELKLKNSELVEVEASLKSTDYGEKKYRLEEVVRTGELWKSSSREWDKIINALQIWEDDEVVTDYVSNNTLQLIGELRDGNVTEENCIILKQSIAEDKFNIEEELDQVNKQKREIVVELKEKRERVDDLQNNRKTHSAQLREARTNLEQLLSDKYGRRIKVYIFADLFDVKDEKWKNAIEGRLARLKKSLITEEKYSHDAALLFRKMRKYEEIDLINTAAIVKDAPKADKGSLYEAVSTDKPFADICLKRYLGRIMKCESLEELENVRDGVTPDCYSYSNYIFRHLKERDYTINVCIGSKISKTKLDEMITEVEKLDKEYKELSETSERLKASRNFECLNHDIDRIIELSQAKKELDKTIKVKENLERTIGELENGEIAKLNDHKITLEAQNSDVEKRIEELRRQEIQQNEKKAQIDSRICNWVEELDRRLESYIPNEQIDSEVEQALCGQSESSYKAQKNRELENYKNSEQERQEILTKARQRFNREYPGFGFTGIELDNDKYEQLLKKYEEDYVPDYQSEFQKQCDMVHKSLRDNVIASIHGEIKAAFRHTHEINRLLREISFSDSTYQIEVRKSETEMGQFYDMLMAKELDSKVIDNDGYDGQMSFGEETFLQKYKLKIDLLTEKFTPARNFDDKQVTHKKQEMERFADYRNYLSFSMYERVIDDKGNEHKNYVDEMAGRDSGGEGQNPKYVALLAGFAMLYMQQSNRDSRIKLVLLDEAFSKMDQERSEVCLKYARKLNLQLIVCVPDERLQSLIQNVDCVYGFRRHNNQTMMMHIDKGSYLKMLEGN